MFAKMTKTWTGAARAGLAAIAISAAAIGAAHAAEITGAGATFPAPVYTKWAEQYAAQGGDTLNYQAIGSGAGVTQIINRTVDFGASDTAVAPERLASQQLLQFPAVIGGVVIVVNVPGVDGNALKLTGPIIADIYLGKVRLWNDARIRAINPGVALPAIAIAPAYRADSSGTTNIFSSYIASVSLPFSSRVGAGNSVAWVSGVGAPGNAGVAGTVHNTKGGLGYVEFAYATENHMQTPMLLNRSGKYVSPSTAAFASASATVNWANAPNMSVSMNNTLGATNWPIVGASYILVPKNPSDEDRAENVLKFFDWSWKNGAAAADQLHYVMLPVVVQNQARARWAQVKTNGKSVWK